MRYTWLPSSEIVNQEYLNTASKEGGDRTLHSCQPTRIQTLQKNLVKTPGRNDNKERWEIDVNISHRILNGNRRD